MNDTLDSIKAMMSNWEAEACVIGNVTAGDTIAAIINLEQQLAAKSAECEQLLADNAAMVEHLTWIANQFCERSNDDDAVAGTHGHCRQSGDCITEYCLSCYAAAMLEADHPGRALLERIAKLEADNAKLLQDAKLWRMHMECMPRGASDQGLR